MKLPKRDPLTDKEHAEFLRHNFAKAQEHYDALTNAGWTVVIVGLSHEYGDSEMPYVDSIYRKTVIEERLADETKPLKPTRKKK